MDVSFIAALVFTFLVTVVLARVFIPVLKSIKMGQKILDIGPRWHKGKEGTPTMGGLFFIAASIIPVIAGAIWRRDFILVIHYLFVLFNGMIGFVDDYVKFFKKQNAGLTASQKLVLQFAVTAAYLAALYFSGSLSTTIALPFTDATLDLGVFYYIIVLVGIVFTVNSANLTDGIDGLCSSVTAVSMVFLSVLAIKSGNIEAGILSGTMLGGALGFLVYNFHPAKVFMGDTGSLYMGAVVCAVAMMLDIPIILFFVGIIYYIESVSVMTQVISYKLTKKRVFKMTPIHHHFEMCSWNEVKIVFVFSVVTAVFAAIGCFGFIGIM
ncbi:MAG: phospho-N-acetylmuramoyl-pentapeptide-transferase [Clostridia bacterium]|nr:phospho-N-acetylmuramoyl-pentapeptide-transferase [Clostridia bacterium]